METVETHLSHGGTQGVYRHRSAATGTEMTFALFLPPQAADGPVPLITYLSGLTCTHANVMDKGEYRAAAARHGLAVLCPDTSPRHTGVEGEADDWQFGAGAGFYLDAAVEPWAKYWNMATYVGDELPKVVARNFPLDMARQGIFGHSMGGHGAISLALKHPDTYRTSSAFAPIVAPSQTEWGAKALTGYLGDDRKAWRAYDSVSLIEDGHRVEKLLVDQGTADGFLDEGLKPWLLEKACEDAGIPLTLRMQEGYDHSYFFISTFMADHIGWHAEGLGAAG